MASPSHIQPTAHSSNSHGQKAYWGSKSYTAGWPMINVAYYSGVIPLYWKKQGIKYEMKASRPALLRWRVTVYFTLLLNILVLLGYLKNAEKLGFNFHEGHNILSMQATASTMIVNSIIVHLNTLLKVQDIKTFFNTWTRFYESFRDKSLNKNTASKYEKYDKGCAKLLLLFFTQFHCTPGLMIGMYLARCDIHVLAPLLPICKEDDQRRIASFEHIPALAFFQFFIGTMVINSCMIYLHFLPIFISQGIVVEKEMRSLLDEGSKLPQQKLLTQFYHNYRSLQIILFEANKCMSLIAPCHIMYLIVVCGLILHLLLGMKFGPMETFSAAMFLVLMIIYITFAGGTLSRIETSSKELLIKAKNMCPAHKYMDKVNRSCRPLALWVGIFGSLPPDILFILGLATLDFTITLYLM